jgi:hypothetical protein
MLVRHIFARLCDRTQLRNDAVALEQRRRDHEFVSGAEGCDRDAFWRSIDLKTVAKIITSLYSRPAPENPLFLFF